MSQYAFYIDDTDATVEPQSKYPIWGGVLVLLADYPRLQEKLWKIKTDSGLTKESPIKWSPGQADARYSAQRKIKNQNEFRTEVLKLISNNDLKIVISAIDTNIMEPPPKEVFFSQSRCTEHLMQRFQYFLQSRIAQKDRAPNSGRIISDFPGNKTESRLAKNYRNIWSGEGSFNIKYDLLQETIYYSHSFCCEGIQLADYAVGAIRYTLEKRRKHFYDLIKDNLLSYRNNIKGAGLIVFPSNSKLFDALITN